MRPTVRMTIDERSFVERMTSPTGTMVALKRCLCGAMLRVEHFRVRRYSGIVNYDETLCADCAAHFAHHPRVVCLACKSLQGFVEPYKDKVTGFAMLADRCYHIQPCPRCVDGIASTPVLEHVAHCRQNGIATRLDLDLLQEIEQKGLQGVVEADNLRAEFNQLANYNAIDPT